MYFYDAGHSYGDHFLSFSHFITAMDNVFVFIVDDWNWKMVQEGTKTAMALYSIEVVASVEVGTVPLEGIQGSWHNGMIAYVVRKL